MKSAIKTSYRNVWSKATFTVLGKEAAERFEMLPSWQRESEQRGRNDNRRDND